MAEKHNLPERMYRVHDGKLETLRLLKVNKVSIDLIDDRGVTVRERRRLVELKLDVPVIEAKTYFAKLPWRRTQAAAWRDALAIQRDEVRRTADNITHSQRELASAMKRHKEAKRELAAFERKLASAK